MVHNNENELVGWVSFQDFYGRPAYSGTAEISIYLHPNQRGKGNGKTILTHAINSAASLGIHSLLGFIFAHNLASVKLFENAGFATWGKLPDVALLDGTFRSLLIMGLKIKSD
jgi:phosphinothricin acetyltransferase